MGVGDQRSEVGQGRGRRAREALRRAPIVASMRRRVRFTCSSAARPLRRGFFAEHGWTVEMAPRPGDEGCSYGGRFPAPAKPVTDTEAAATYYIVSTKKGGKK